MLLRVKFPTKDVLVIFAIVIGGVTVGILYDKLKYV